MNNTLKREVLSFKMAVKTRWDFEKIIKLATKHSHTILVSCQRVTSAISNECARLGA